LIDRLREDLEAAIDPRSAIAQRTDHSMVVCRDRPHQKAPEAA
jgi:hypothetical protein